MLVWRLFRAVRTLTTSEAFDSSSTGRNHSEEPRRLPHMFLRFSYDPTGWQHLSAPPPEVGGEEKILRTVSFPNLKLFHAASESNGHSLTGHSSEPSELRNVLRRCSLSAEAHLWLNTDAPWSTAELQDPCVLTLMGNWPVRAAVVMVTANIGACLLRGGRHVSPASDVD